MNVKNRLVCFINPTEKLFAVIIVKIVWLIIFLSLSLPSVGQKNYVFESLTTQSGLSQNAINCVFQDRHNRIWVGTNDGLNCFDGYDFKQYKITNSEISSNIIVALNEDNQSNLLISTIDKGLCIYNYRFNRFLKSPVLDSLNKHILNQPILRIVRTDSNKFYLSMDSHGIELNLAYQNILLKTVRFYDSDNSLFERTIRISSYADTLLAGTEKGIFLFRRNTDSTFKATSPQPILRKFLIKSIFALPNGYIVSCRDRDGGTFFIDHALKPHYLSHHQFDQIVTDAEGQLWMGTAEKLYLKKMHFSNDSINLEQVFEKKLFESELSKVGIASLHIDSFGVLWIGTTNKGIGRLNPKGNPFVHHKYELNSTFIKEQPIRSIKEDRFGNIWMGTLNGGVSLIPYSENIDFNKDIKDLPEYLNIFANVYALHEIEINGKNYMISGTDYGLKNAMYHLDQEKNISVTTMPKKIHKINNNTMCYASHDQILWLGTYGEGLFRYSFDTDSLEHIQGTSTHIIRNLLYDSQDRLWIGTSNGLNLIMPSEQQRKRPKIIKYIHQEGNTTSLSFNYILSLFESKNQDIWIGTSGGGLNKFRPETNSFTSVGEIDGLANGVVNSIEEDSQGNLWLSSNLGLTKYHPTTGQIINYTTVDGLQKYEYNGQSCTLQSGEMIFGGIDGFNVFKPEEFYKDTTLPSVIFTGIDINNQPVLTGKKIDGNIILKEDLLFQEKIDLKYSQRNITIHFAASHANSGDKLAYKYILSGVDEDWVETNKKYRFAKYSNLDPGSYKFQVIASNGEGIWSKTPLILSVKVEPPLWRSNLAIVVYALLVIVGFIFFDRFSIIRNERKQQLLADHFEKEKIKQLTQFKLRFFTNISHEFRTPLTLIHGYLDSILRNKDKMETAQVANDIKIVQRNSNLLLRLIDQLLNFRKFEENKLRLQISKVGIIAFTRDIMESFDLMARNKSINYEFKYNQEEIPLWIDAGKIEKVIYNLLSNAFKYTARDGDISISITASEHNVHLSISDTGIGISKDQQDKVFERFYRTKKGRSFGIGTGIGLSFVKNLIELHQGTIALDSSKGKGTNFHIKLPLGNVHLKDNELVDIINNDVKNNAEEKTSFAPNNELPGSENEIVDTENTSHEHTILVVEDNQDIRTFLQRELKRSFNIHTAENGLEGLKKAIGEMPDLIISDAMMPEMDGFELCKAMKNDDRTSHIPIIMLTAKTSLESRVKGFEEGADIYLEKPFQVEALLAQISAIFRSRKLLWKKLDQGQVIKKVKNEPGYSKRDQEFLSRLNSLIEEHITNNELGVDYLASEFNMSSKTLTRKLKTLTGKTPGSYIRFVRLNMAAKLLAHEDLGVAQVTYQVGFSSLHHFRQAFQKQFELSPNEYKKTHKKSR